MRVAIVYDCLFPWTIGGAERWYRSMAERLSRQGHDVTILTLRQWPRDDPPRLPGIKVVAVGPRMALYGRHGQRRILPPLIFGLGILCHLLAKGRRYDHVHTASFPFFSLLAAGLARMLWRFDLAADWHEVWSRAYWRAYLGRAGGRVGWWVQSLCAAIPHHAFCFSRLHGERLTRLRGGAAPVLLSGEYAAPLHPPLIYEQAASPPTIVFAGRMIPEKRVPLLVDALALIMARDTDVRASLFGDGPERALVMEQVRMHGLSGRIATPGFVAREVLERAQSEAAVMVQPSAREGYGMVVVEAAARGVPIVLVAGEDNAATELVETGQNGAIAPEACPAALAKAIRSCLDGGGALRARTRRWFAREAQRLSIDHSLAVIAATLEGGRASDPAGRGKDFNSLLTTNK